MSPRTLVAFYSMSGSTRAIANEIRDRVHAHVEEIAEPRRRRGLAGMARGLLDTLLQRPAEIRAASKDPAQYDLLLLGGPVWAGRMAGPVRAYASRYGSRAAHVAFFCTEAGTDAETAFRDLRQLCAQAPEATLAVDLHCLAPDSHRADLDQFVARIALSARSPGTLDRPAALAWPGHTLH
jgi:flavodoxin